MTMGLDHIQKIGSSAKEVRVEHKTYVRSYGKVHTHLSWTDFDSTDITRS